MVRIIELMLDTDDKVDPSCELASLLSSFKFVLPLSHLLLFFARYKTDGVVIFLILSAATEVAAMVCACVPVAGPHLFSEYKRRRHPSYNQSSSKLSRLTTFSGSRSRPRDDQIALNPIEISSDGHNKGGSSRSHRKLSGGIWIENQIEVTVGDEHDQA